MAPRGRRSAQEVRGTRGNARGNARAGTRGKDASRAATNLDIPQSNVQGHSIQAPQYSYQGPLASNYNLHGTPGSHSQNLPSEVAQSSHPSYGRSQHEFVQATAPHRVDRGQAQYSGSYANPNVHHFGEDPPGLPPGLARVVGHSSHPSDVGRRKSPVSASSFQIEQTQQGTHLQGHTQQVFQPVFQQEPPSVAGHPRLPQQQRPSSAARRPVSHAVVDSQQTRSMAAGAQQSRPEQSQPGQQEQHSQVRGSAVHPSQSGGTLHQVPRVATSHRPAPSPATPWTRADQSSVAASKALVNELYLIHLDPRFSGSPGLSHVTDAFILIQSKYVIPHEQPAAQPLNTSTPTNAPPVVVADDQPAIRLPGPTGRHVTGQKRGRADDTSAGLDGSTSKTDGPARPRKRVARAETGGLTDPIQVDDQVSAGPSTAVIDFGAKRQAAISSLPIGYLQDVLGAFQDFFGELKLAVARQASNDGIVYDEHSILQAALSRWNGERMTYEAKATRVRNYQARQGPKKAFIIGLSVDQNWKIYFRPVAHHESALEGALEATKQTSEYPDVLQAMHVLHQAQTGTPPQGHLEAPVPTASSQSANQTNLQPGVWTEGRAVEPGSTRTRATYQNRPDGLGSEDHASSHPPVMDDGLEGFEELLAGINTDEIATMFDPFALSIDPADPIAALPEHDGGYVAPTNPVASMASPGGDAMAQVYGHGLTHDDDAWLTQYIPPSTGHDVGPSANPENNHTTIQETSAAPATEHIDGGQADPNDAFLNYTQEETDLFIDPQLLRPDAPWTVEDTM